MRISFDIDNTLIPYGDDFEVEKKMLSKILGLEYLRKGTKELFKTLEANDHEIWIYTTSSRSIFKLRLTFMLYGLKPVKIINEHINQKVLKVNNYRGSKNPKLFGIDIHVDDSEGVQLEGQRHHFRTIIISPDDEDWTRTILEKIDTEAT